VVLHVQAALALVQVRAVLRVRVHLVQVARHVRPVLVLVAHVPAVLQVLVLREPVLREVVQDQVVVVVAVLAPRVLSERVALRTRAASPSAPREKNLSRERLRASAVPWCHAATATPLFASAADLRFRTSQTRLALTLAS
jgi:hypothetical protein